MSRYDALKDLSDEELSLTELDPSWLACAVATEWERRYEGLREKLGAARSEVRRNNERAEAAEAEVERLRGTVVDLRMLAQRKTMSYEERRDHAERIARKVDCGSNPFRTGQNVR